LILAAPSPTLPQNFSEAIDEPVYGLQSTIVLARNSEQEAAGKNSQLRIEFACQDTHMIGGTVSHYKILGRIGAGGMGTVYKGEDTRLKRTVALKFLPPELTRDPESKERFIQEAQAASALQHNNICVIHDIDQTPDGQLFIVMDYYDGETLKQKIERGPLPVEEALELAFQIAGGLASAHARGIIHRDVKPANVIVTMGGSARLLDFGLAKLAQRLDITKTGSTLGTAAYMSPEQARGDTVDHRTDVWSLGVVLFEMLTGRLPFRGEFEQGIVYSILNEDPPSLVKQRPAIPSSLEAVVFRSLEKDPARRYGTLEDLISDLASVRSGSNASGAALLGRQQRRQTILKSLRWALPPMLIVIAAIAYLRSGMTLPWTSNDTSLMRASSITVLPLKDYSPERDQAFFCNGIADEIASSLSQIPELRIVSGTRAFGLQERETDVRELGKMLRVASVLEGSVRKAAGQLRITMQLLNVSDGSQIWTQQFDRSTADVIGVQEDVARSVAAALQITLAPQTAEKMLPRQTKNPEAYECFLRGNYLVKLYCVSYREQDIQSAIKMFEKAVTLDPKYALAYGGLAWAYEHRYVYGRYQNPADREQVVRAIGKGYELDPGSGSMNAGMGYVLARTGNNDRAYDFFRKAIAIDARSLWVNHVVGLFLAGIGLPDKASRFFLTAIEMDPYYLFSCGELAECYEYSGEFSKAESYYLKALALSPDDRVYRAGYLRFLIKSGKLHQAEEMLRRAMEAYPEFKEYSRCQALLLASRGKKTEALALWKNAEVYSLLKMNREALQFLEANAGKSYEYLYLALLNNPFYLPLRDDPRFQSTLAKEKLTYEERSKKYGAL
jgi:serine/threonine protein kinase/Tfp pilus assembly protein PilF